MCFVSFLSDDSVSAGSVFDVVWEFTLFVIVFLLLKIHTFCGVGVVSDPWFEYFSSFSALLRRTTLILE